MTVWGPEEGQQYESSSHALLDSTFNRRWDQDIEGLVSQGADAAQFMSGNMRMMPDKESNTTNFAKEQKKQVEELRDKTEEGTRNIPIYIPGSPSPFHKGATITQHIDRNHDVPLLAAALDDGHGFYGIAVDRRIPHAFTNEGITYDPAEFVHHHEEIEHADMTMNGTPYQQAHDEIATPYEKDKVTQFAKDNGVDPEKFWKNHQQFWTSNLEKASAQPPEKVHPHTYLKPYEDSNHKYRAEMAEKRREAQDTFPGQQELNTSYNTDQSYGDPAAPYLKTGNPVMKQKSINIARQANSPGQLVGYASPLNQEEANFIHKAWLGSQKSSVSALGFDPRYTILSSKEDKKLNVGGLTDRDKPHTMWAAGDDPAFLTHESLHRGLRMLREADLMPQGMQWSDEMVVRALMRRHFGEHEEAAGDISKEQSQLSKSVPKGYLDRIEAAAARYLAKQRPGGPR